MKEEHFFLQKKPTDKEKKRQQPTDKEEDSKNTYRQRVTKRRKTF